MENHTYKDPKNDIKNKIPIPKSSQLWNRLRWFVTTVLDFMIRWYHKLQEQKQSFTKFSNANARTINVFSLWIDSGNTWSVIMKILPYSQSSILSCLFTSFEIIYNHYDSLLVFLTCHVWNSCIPWCVLNSDGQNQQFLINVSM